MTPEPAALATTALTVPAEPAHLSAIHAGLASFWAVVAASLPAPLEVGWRVRFETAVAEIGSNIVRHAYPPQGEGGPLRLRLQAFPDRVEAVFSDNGVPYRPPAPASAPGAGKPGDTPPEDAFSVKEGGYGLELARAAVDDLDYQRSAGGENVWRLVKRL